MGFRTGSLVWEQPFCSVAIDCNLVEVTIYKEFYWGQQNFKSGMPKKRSNIKRGGSYSSAHYGFKHANGVLFLTKLPSRAVLQKIGLS